MVHLAHQAMCTGAYVRIEDGTGGKAVLFTARPIRSVSHGAWKGSLVAEHCFHLCCTTNE